LSLKFPKNHFPPNYLKYPSNPKFRLNLRFHLCPQNLKSLCFRLNLLNPKFLKNRPLRLYPLNLKNPKFLKNL
jgi:hypothetical protein